MKISEIFQSIQGEGTNAGKPAVFLRTALCNLTCSWCDTKYTWDWDNFDYNEEVKEISISSIEKQITQYKIHHLVITGGEPLMQQDELVKLISGLNKLGFFIEIETNCTIKPTPEMLELVTQWNVSPKTFNSGNKLELYENNECYNLFASLDNAIFKFVVENEDDMNEINGFIKKYDLVKNRVLLMPQASRKKELSLLANLIKDIAKSNELGFSPRLHVEKWGNQRGK